MKVTSCCRKYLDLAATHALHGSNMLTRYAYTLMEAKMHNSSSTNPMILVRNHIVAMIHMLLVKHPSIDPHLP